MDSRGRLELVPFQADDLEARFPSVTREACARELHFLDEQGRVFRGARAMAEVARRLGGAWRVAGLLTAYPPFSWPAALVYRWVAKNRHRLAREDRCEVDS